MNTPFLKRLALRFVTVFGVLLYFPTPLNVLPVVSDPIDAVVEQAWTPLLSVAAHLFGKDLPPPDPSGSGDGLREWLRLLCIAALALTVGLAWSLDRRRTNDAKVQDALSDYLRLNLVIAMFTYGFIKLRAGQMPPLDALHLDTPYGDSSPMGLLWRFMGFSGAYQRFSGAMEALGGVLLLTRRTRTAGALVTAGVMTQVVMLNLCFDVPVKEYSSLLLLTALFLLLPDARRVLDFALGNTVRASERTPLYFTGSRLRWVRMLPFAGFGLLVAVTNFIGELPKYPPNPLAGVYRVLDQQAGQRVESVTVLGPYFRMRRPAGPPLVATSQLDGGVLFLKSARDPAVDGEVTFEELDGGTMRVAGRFGADAYDLTVKKLEPEKTTLMGRGFHWVQERPINW